MEPLVSIEYTDSHRFSSSLVPSAYYNEDTEIVFICFSHSTAVYAYRISPEVWRKFKQADSAGQFYNTFIKGRGSVPVYGDLMTASLKDVKFIKRTEHPMQSATADTPPAFELRLDWFKQTIQVFNYYQSMYSAGMFKTREVTISDGEFRVVFKFDSPAIEVTRQGGDA